MKYIFSNKIKTAIIYSVFCIFFSCAQSQDGVNPDKTPLLINKKWKLVSSVVSPQINGTTDYYSLLPTTFTDNILEFKIIDKGVKQMVISEGDTRSSAAPDEYLSGNWSFGTQNTALNQTTFDPRGFGENNQDYMRWTPTRLQGVEIPTAQQLTTVYTIWGFSTARELLSPNVTLQNPNAPAMKITSHRKISGATYYVTDIYVVQ